jgi:radical SAM-linked protein
VRIRVRFAKTGKIRWTSHRDLARVWERAIRRVGLPVAYSQGFSPRPKVHFGLALSTGHESLAEYIDIDVDVASPAAPAADATTLADLATRFTDALPVGIEATAVEVIEPSAPSLQQAVTSCSWLVEIRDVEPPAVADAIARAMAAAELPVTRERKGKSVTDDVRPYLLDLSVVGPTDAGTEIDAHLATQPRGLRIGELIAVLDCGGTEGRVRRLHQWMLLDGARCEPLAGPPGAASAPHAEARAS